MRFIIAIAAIVTIPKFVLVHPTVDRAIRINSDHIMYYEDFDQDDLYYKGKIFFKSGSYLPVVETADEIDLMFQDEYEKKGKK